jgi:hypothetical protein
MPFERSKSIPDSALDGATADMIFVALRFDALADEFMCVGGAESAGLVISEIFEEDILDGMLLGTVTGTEASLAVSIECRSSLGVP